MTPRSRAAPSRLRRRPPRATSIGRCEVGRRVVSDRGHHGFPSASTWRQLRPRHPRGRCGSHRPAQGRWHSGRHQPRAKDGGTLPRRERPTPSCTQHRAASQRPLPASVPRLVHIDIHTYRCCVAEKRALTSVTGDADAGRPAARAGRKLDLSRNAVILDATLAVLAESGYDRMTIDAVAARAGAARATVYRRWAAKPTSCSTPSPG